MDVATTVGLGVLVVFGGVPVVRRLWRHVVTVRADRAAPPSPAPSPPASAPPPPAFPPPPPLARVGFRFAGNEVRALIAEGARTLQAEAASSLERLQALAAQGRELAARVGPMAPQPLTRERFDAERARIATLTRRAERLEVLAERVDPETRYELSLEDAEALLQLATPLAS